jgi:hypothetical protein
MSEFASLADDFYCNMTLGTEMPLPGTREAILHYVEQLQKRYPALANFYSRARNDYIIEGDKDAGSYRWSSIEPRRLSSGFVNPNNIAEALDQHADVLELAPYALSISALDCDSLDLMFGFDFTYEGDHNRLVSDVLGLAPAFEPIGASSLGKIVNHQPSVTIAIDDDCRLHCRVGVETRTTPYQLRTGDFGDDQLSVYVSVRHFGSVDPQVGLSGTLRQLSQVAVEVTRSYVVDSILRPLANSISIR